MSQHDTREAVEAMARLHDLVRFTLGMRAPEHDETAAMLRRLHARAVAAEAEAEELQRTFDLRWKADMRAIKRWQDATGRTLTWPDHADAVVFLLEKLDAAEAALATARADALREAADLFQDERKAWHGHEPALAILSLIPAQEAQTHD